MPTTESDTYPNRSHNEPVSAWWAAGSLCVAVLAAAPLFLNPGFLNTRGGGDSPFLLFRLHQLYAALSEGIFPVRWMPDAAFGLGYPFFNYYAALPYYFAAGFRALGFSFVLSLKLTHLLGFLVAGWGAYAWVRRITGHAEAGFLASAAYTFAPFHIVNVYVRGDSLSEFWAMAWYPLILLAILEAARQPSSRQVAWVGLASGALVMTHNISALIFAPVATAYAVGCALWVQPVGAGDLSPARKMIPLALAGFLGLALSAWVWLPALGERSYAQLGEQTTGYFFYGNHFRAANLIQSELLFNYDIGQEAESPFSMGRMQAILILGGAALLIARMIRQRTWWRDGFLLAGLLLSTWMITPLACVVWEHMPLLPFVQFPWRWLSVQALFGAGVTSALAPHFPPRMAAQQRGASPGSPVGADRGWLVLIPITVATLSAIAGMAGLRLNFIPLNDADVTPQRLQWYESFSGNIGTTIRHEYLPVWTNPRPYASDVLLGRAPRAKFLTGEGSAERITAGAASQIWAINVTSPSARIAVPLLYWPGWRAEVDGQQTTLTPVEGLGYAQLDVPHGSHMLRVWLGRTNLRLGSEVASLVALLLAIWLFQPRPPRWNRVKWVRATGVAVAGAALVVLLHTLPEDAPLTGPLNADFAQEAYFHHSPEGIPYTDGRVLLSAKYNADNSQASTISLGWGAPTAPGGVSVVLVAPPQQSAQGAPGPDLPAAIPFKHLTPGLYFALIRTPYARPLTENGLTRGDIYVEPVVVSSQPGGPGASAMRVEASFGNLALMAATVEDQLEHLVVTLWWQALEEVTKNYAIALRAYDTTGNQWAALDTQAGGAGLYPTGLWLPGEVVPDTVWLSLPQGTPPGVYTIQVTLYNAATLEAVNQVSLTPVEYRALSPHHQPCGEPEPHTFDEAIGLDHVNLTPTLEQGKALSVEVGWIVKVSPNQEYQVEWSLIQDEQTLWATRTPLAPGSDPTSWESSDCRAYVLGRHRLDVPGSLPPGDYALTLRLLSENGDFVGEPYMAGRVTITERDRTFDVPALDTALDVSFGGQIRLWGYSVSQQEGALDLAVAWGALVDPAFDYKYFVHLFDPTNERIIAQADAMPRAYTYPTSQWSAGEVVEETISLEVDSAPPGQYRIALGWYDPATGNRLIAVTASGEVLPGQRVILPNVILIP